MSESNRRAWSFAAAALAGLSQSVAADESSAAPRETSAPASMEVIVVTASRVPVAARDVGGSLTVLDAEDLAVRQATFVADALRDVPGVTVSRGGGYGAVTQARIRGAEGNHTLVLIDGIEVNNPVANSEFDFANLPVGDIERIEVLRGAQSALHGSDAIGGVINIVTRAREPGLDGRASIESGSLGTHAAAVTIGGGGDRLTGGVRASRLETDGENFSRFGTERDGFESDTLALNGRARIGERVTVDANVHRLATTQQFDTQDFAFPPTATQGLLVDDDVSSRMVQRFSRLEAQVATDRVMHRVGIGDTRTQNTFYDADEVTGRNEGTKTKFDYQGTIALAPDAGDRSPSLTLAVEHERLDYVNRGAAVDAPENQEQNDAQNSVVAEYRMSFTRGSFSAGARHDANDLFDDADTFRLAGTYRFTDRTRMRASVGTGVSNPGFFDLFGFFPGSFVGNPALRPEHSTSFDVGIDREFGAHTTLGVTYFRANLEDEIVTTFDAGSFLSSVGNLDGESRRRGVEVALAATPVERWQIAASYTYTDAREPSGAQELRRPRHVGSLDNTVRFLDGRARVHVGVNRTGSQFDSELVASTPADRAALAAFTVVDIAGTFDLGKRLQVYARIENALDEQYEEWFSYRARGRSWTAGVALRLAP